MCYLRLTWESKFIWHTDFTFWAVAAIHEKLLETYLWFLAASLGVHHPPWRRNGQPPRDLCLYLTTPEEKPSKAPLSHETGQVDNVPAQERLPQTSWQSQWHCWTSPLHVWSLVTLHGSRWSAPPTHSSIFEIEFGAQRHFGNILAYLWPHSTSRTTIHQSIPRRAFNGPAPQATQWTLWGNWCDFFYCHKQNSFRMAQFASFQLYTPFPDMVLRRRVHYASCTGPLEVLLAWQQTLVGFNESCLEGAPFNVDAVQRINLNSFTTGKAEITAFQVGFITCEKQRK